MSFDRVIGILNHFREIDYRLSNEIAAENCSSQDKQELTREISEFINGKNLIYRNEMFEFLGSDPLFRLDYNQSKEGMRHLTRARLLTLVQRGFIIPQPSNTLEHEKSLQYGEALSYHDLSVGTLIGAQFVLFSGSIEKLGTEYHHQNFLNKAKTCELRGCFALTELGHGSNVRGIETTAVLDLQTDQWIINSPNETSQKYWIGGGIEWAQIATVFAQLYIGKVHYGVHGFLVPLRDKNGKPLKGVRIKDCGHKMGLNGIDNGRFWFDHVAIPRVNLLDRFAQVSKEGEYSTPIQNNDARFAVTMGNLLTGRVSLSNGATNVCKIVLTTAIKYAFTRRQFGPPGKEELPIINYTTHQVRLMPLLATTYAHHFIAKKVAVDFHKAQQDFDIDAIKDIHVLVSGLKGVATWHLAETLQVTREACGGQGYKSSNRIGILKADADIQLTYEGDNSILLQQVSKDLIKSSSQNNNNNTPQLDPHFKTKFDEEYLRSRAFQSYAFQVRAADHVTLLIEMSRSKSNNQLEDGARDVLATDAGLAHIERQVFNHLLNAENTAPPKIQNLLSLIRNLYAISRLHNSPTFLRGQYFTLEKQQAISKLFVKLCGELKEVCAILVDAFGIPDHLLGTIAGDWVQSYSYLSEDTF